MEVLEEHCTEKQVCKIFKIKVDDKTEIEITKWMRMFEEPFGCNEYDGDWEFATKEDKHKYNLLPQDVQDEVYDFINDLDL